MRGPRIAAILFLSGAILGLAACRTPQAPTPRSIAGKHLIHNGKMLVLVRLGTKSEAEAAARKLAVSPGDEVWYYETALTEMMAGETGYCIVRGGAIISRFIVAAV